MMTINQLIKLLKKWPGDYKIEDEHWNPVTGILLSRCSGNKGTVWIRFRKKYCEHCQQEIK